MQKKELVHASINDVKVIFALIDEILPFDTTQGTPFLPPNKSGSGKEVHIFALIYFRPISGPQSAYLATYVELATVVDICGL